MITITEAKYNEAKKYVGKINMDAHVTITDYQGWNRDDLLQEFLLHASKEWSASHFWLEGKGSIHKAFYWFIKYTYKTLLRTSNFKVYLGHKNPDEYGNTSSYTVDDYVPEEPKTPLEVLLVKQSLEEIQAALKPRDFDYLCTRLNGGKVRDWGRIEDRIMNQLAK